jgi:hypothetical protein
MKNLQKDADDEEQINPGTGLLIAIAVLLIPLLFAGFLFQ